LKAAGAHLALARQDARLYPLQLEKARRALEAARHKQAAAQHAFVRTSRLVDVQLADQQEQDALAEQVCAAQAAVAIALAEWEERQRSDPALAVCAAEAEAEAARVELRQAEHVLTECALRASEAGTVLAVSARLGEIVGGPGAPAVVLVAPRRSLVVRADVEQEYVCRVGRGLRAVIREDTPVPRTWPGTVRRVGAYFRRRVLQADPAELKDVPTVECVVEFLPPCPRLPIGQRVQVHIVLDGLGEPGQVEGASEGR
jgi:multidrug resistance efflux pump